MARVITLTTDFGVDDHYAGVVKGVILGINPGAAIVDLCHSIAPQNILQASFLLGNSFRYFPFESIHLAVVDPGVGTGRKPLIIKTFHPPAIFVAPDNGLLSFLLPPTVAATLAVAGAGPAPVFVSLRGMEKQLLAFEIADPRFWLKPVSATFHGRDIFAPVVGYLSVGYSVAAFGPPVDSMVYQPLPAPEHLDERSLKGTVLHVDHFGNIITNFRKDDLSVESFELEMAGRRIHGLSATYAAGDNLIALIGSSGYLEIALKDDNAAHQLKARVGDPVLCIVGAAS